MTPENPEPTVPSVDSQPGAGSFAGTPGGLVDLVQRYYDFRGLIQPDANQAFLFLVSEMGELGDALVSSQGHWIRNNPERERHIPSEIGDVLMMLTVFAAAQGIDPVEALKEKMRKKGFAG